MLRTRIWTALVALPAVLAMIALAPDPIFSGFVAVVAIVALTEIGFMIRMNPFRPAIALIVAAGVIPALILLYQERGSWVVAASVIVAMLALVAEVAISGAQGEREEVPLAILGALYVGVLYPYFALLRNQPGGIKLLTWMFLLAVASDSGAYFAGSYLGRIKLAPKVSPKKTVEGALGGLGLCVLAGWILRGLLVPQWTPRTLTIAAVAIGISAQLGDLACSAYKRVAGVKDSGWIFPGHGGLIDRASSLVFAVVFTYYYAR